MSSQEGKYNVKAVSKLLGIQPVTLRAWERRYKIIAPNRNDSGHRIYTEEHIQILKWLMNKINEGFTISQAVNLYIKNHELLNNQVEKNTETDHSIKLMDELLNSLLNFDEGKTVAYFNKGFSLYSLDKFVIEILSTIHLKIDDQYEAGKINSAQKNYAFSYLRSRISMIMHTLPVNGHLAKILAVCAPNETDELELLIFSLFLKNKGFEVIYIGASIMERDYDVVIEKVSPEVLFLSCTSVINMKQAFELVDSITSKFTSLQIGLGGKAFSKVNRKILTSYEKYFVGENQHQWNKWVKENLGQ